MISFPDTADDRPERTMWPSKSPIALFAVNRVKRLRAAAIQVDYKPGWINCFVNVFGPPPLYTFFSSILIS